MPKNFYWHSREKTKNSFSEAEETLRRLISSHVNEIKRIKNYYFNNINY